MRKKGSLYSLPSLNIRTVNVRDIFLEHVYIARRYGHVPTRVSRKVELAVIDFFKLCSETEPIQRIGDTRHRYFAALIVNRAGFD